MKETNQLQGVSETFWGPGSTQEITLVNLAARSLFETPCILKLVVSDICR
jgi:hypothetical protein